DRHCAMRPTRLLSDLGRAGPRHLRGETPGRRDLAVPATVHARLPGRSMRLPADQCEGIAHRARRDLDETAEGSIELDHEQHGARDRQRAYEKGRDDGGVAWRIESEAAEDDGEPERENDEKRRGHPAVPLLG